MPSADLRRERDEARAGGRREHGAEAAVDVAAAEDVHRLVAGDRVQRHAAEVPAQAQVAAVVLQLWLVHAVGRDLRASKPSTRSLVPGLMMLARNRRAEPSRSRACTLSSALKSLLGSYSSCTRSGVVAVALEVAASGRSARCCRPSRRGAGYSTEKRSAESLPSGTLTRAFDVDGAVGAERQAAVAFRASSAPA